MNTRAQNDRLHYLFFFQRVRDRRCYNIRILIKHFNSLFFLNVYIILYIELVKFHLIFALAGQQQR